MKVILLNGSPREKGCTFTALSIVGKALGEAGIQTETVWVGNKPIAGCIGCRSCGRTGRCFVDDGVNAFVQKAADADGLVIGSPVYYAGITGGLKSFLDRSFYTGGSAFWGKPGAAVVSCRRGGESTAFESINKYFTICGMPVVSSQYWNMVHGTTPEEVLKDEEGVQTMRTLGKNMAWLLQCIELGRQNGIPVPARETPVRTNFIR